MSSVIKWNNASLRKFEREATKEMNKRIAKINKNINPIVLPSTVPSDLSGGVTINNMNDNSINISGNVNNSQIGGTGNRHVNQSEVAYIENVLSDLKNLSKTISNNDKEELKDILNELQETGEVKSAHQTFFEEHPLIMMAVSTVVSWAATYGLDNLIPILQSIFAGVN